MTYKISVTSQFSVEVKRLSKRHRSFMTDLEHFKNSLLENPFQGVEISPGIRKIRMAITSKGRGASGGARVITATAIVSEEEGHLGFLYIYDKADASNVKTEVIKQMARKLGFEV